MFVKKILYSYDAKTFRSYLHSLPKHRRDAPSQRGSRLSFGNLNPEFSAEGTTLTVKVVPLDPQLFLPDDSVLTILSKRADKVAATIYTKKPSAQLQLDIQKHNAQYPPIEILEFDRSHDRFLCIDETVYHLGASIKDLGKKWFAFNRMEISTTELLQQIK